VCNSRKKPANATEGGYESRQPANPGKHRRIVDFAGFE